MQINLRLKAILLICLASLCLLPAIKPALGLLIGLAFAILIDNPWYKTTNSWSKILLKISVIGLGFNLNIKNVLVTGGHAIWFTIASIVLTMLVGVFIGRLLRTSKKTSILITIGTAICGGSAIATLGPAIKAKSAQMAVALATVFVLNGIALLTFPLLGNFIGLSPSDFAIWAAMSIHDTSSVAGAAIAYDPQSVEIALTVKLIRALWIVPLTLIIGYLRHSKSKAPFPYFLLGFLLTSTLSTLLPTMSTHWILLSNISKQILCLTLFLVGVGVTKKLLLKVGIRPLIQATILWLFISILTLLAIYLQWIPPLGSF